MRHVNCNDGVASHCESLMEGLRLQGWKIVIVSGAVKKADVARGRYEKLKSLAEHWEIVDDATFSKFRPKDWWRIRSVARHYGASILHCHGFSGLPVARLLYFVTGLRSVATFHPSIHGADPSAMVGASDLKKRSSRYRWLFALTAPKRLLAASFELSDWLTGDVGVNRKRVVHVPLGIDTDYFRLPTLVERAVARRELSIGPDECVFLLTGRLSWNKGHDLLIDAAGKLKERCPQQAFRVVFVGSGGQLSGMRARAAQVDPSGKLFHFLGFIPEVRTAYWGADVFVLPSRFEGFALAVAEAMCCGLAAVRTPSGGARDQIVDGQTGFIVPFDDAEYLADIMQRLLTDPALRARIAQAGTAHANSLFSLGSMASSTISAYMA